MSSSKCPPWNQFAFCRPLITMAVVMTTLSTGTNGLKAAADEMPGKVDQTAQETAITSPPSANSVAPDVPPVTSDLTQNHEELHSPVHEGSVVKNEVQAPIEPEKESLTAPVPGNQDNALPQPTFNSINTIGPSISSGAAEQTAATGADASDSYAENYSITRNVLTYPLNDPVNGQFSGQPASPLVLREGTDSVTGTVPVVQSKYQELPLSFDDAKARLGQLKLLAAGTNSQDALEHTNQFIRWLSDIVDAHNKMSVAFSKSEVTKPTGVLEKQMSAKFAHLRYESQLLKADLLIEQHRYPEALAPLVEIVLAMPANAIGKAAYHRLQDLGFSTPDAAVSSATVTTGTEISQVNRESKIRSETESTTSAILSEPPKKVALVSPNLHTKRQIASKSNTSKKSSSPQVEKATKVTAKRSHKPN